MDKVIACLLTIVIEANVIICFYKKTGKRLFLLFLISSIPLNIITNLSLNTILEMVQTLELWQYIVILTFLEISVAIIEALYYQAVVKNKRLVWEISFYANATSFIIGSIIFYFINLL